MLWNALAFIQSRDKSSFSQFGLPTKLGVYLASARPVIAARVGDLEKYLEDKKDILYFNPCDSADISDKMITIIKNPDLARRIAKNGQTAAKKYFDEAVLGKKICQIMDC